MTKPKDNDKIIVTAKLKYPFEFYAATLFFVFAFVVILKQMLFDDKTQIEWWLLLLGCLTAFFSVVLIGRHQYKKLVIYADRLVIRPIFSLQPTTIENDNIKGFELFETAIIGDLGYNIRLITKSNQKIVFPQDNYKNYDKIITGLHKSKLTYLGQHELRTNYKQTYSKLLKWSAILFPIIYGLFLLLKMTK
jgi:hypothetical protein